MLKVTRSNIEIAVTPPQIVRFRSNLIQGLAKSHPIHYKWSRSVGRRSRSRCQRSRSQHNVSAVKWYQTATGRLTNLNVVMGVIIKAENDWCAIRWPQVAVHRNCDVSSSKCAFLANSYWSTVCRWTPCSCCFISLLFCVSGIYTVLRKKEPFFSWVAGRRINSLNWNFTHYSW